MRAEMDTQREVTMQDIRAMAVLAQMGQHGTEWIANPVSVDAWVQAVATLAGVAPEAIMAMSVEDAMTLMSDAIEAHGRRMQRMAQRAEMDELVRRALGEGME